MDEAEIEKLQEEAEAAKLEAEAARKEVADLKAELEKERVKDKNLAAMREAKDAAEAKAAEKETFAEKLAREQAEKLAEIEESNRKWKQDQFKDQVEEAWKGICGEDKELKEKIEYEMSQFKGEINTFSQWKDAVAKAHLVVNGTRVEPSVFGRIGTSGAPVKPVEKGFADSEEGLKVLNKLAKGQVDWAKIPRRGKGSYFDKF